MSSSQQYDRLRVAKKRRMVVIDRLKSDLEGRGILMYSVPELETLPDEPHIDLKTQYMRQHLAQLYEWITAASELL